MTELIRLARPRSRNVLAVALVTATTLVGLAAGLTLADSPNSGPTFDQAVFADQVITVDLVRAYDPDGSATLETETVLKGAASHVRTYPSDDKAVHLRVGSRIVLLQGDGTLDFRDVTVMAVAANGALDSGGLVNAPATLNELLAYFDLPPTDTASLQPGTVGHPPGALALIGLGLGLVGVALRRMTRPRLACRHRR